MKMIPIRITLVKWWWTTRNSSRQTQCSSTLCACFHKDPSGVVLCNPFKWDILWFILIENLVICVPSTLARLILFHNHMTKMVVGGKHNVLIHYVDACATNLFCAVLCNPFKWDSLWFIFIKNLVICVPTTLAKGILFQNHTNKQVVGGKHSVLIHYAEAAAPNQKKFLLWNHFE